MATLLAISGFSMLDIAKRFDPDGNLALITEILHQQNEILQDALWLQSNAPYSNRTTRRASLPGGTWREINNGVDSEKSDVSQVTDVIGMLDSMAKHDVDQIDNAPNGNQLRSNEVMSFVEGMGQTMAAAMLYSNTAVDPEKMTGIAPRLASLATTANVLNAGGTGADLTSIYVVDWSPTTVHMIYPQHGVAGFKHEDMGKQLVTGANGGEYRAYVDYFSWKAGLAVKNPKSIGRIANIESAGTSNVFDENDLITLLNRMTKGAGRRIYVNETIMTQMEIRVKDKTNVNYTKEDGLAPGPVLKFKGVPIRQVDQILNTESALT